MTLLEAITAVTLTFSTPNPAAQNPAADSAKITAQAEIRNALECFLGSSIILTGKGYYLYRIEENELVVFVNPGARTGEVKSEVNNSVDMTKIWYKGKVQNPFRNIIDPLTDVTFWIALGLSGAGITMFANRKEKNVWKKVLGTAVLTCAVAAASNAAYRITEPTAETEMRQNLDAVFGKMKIKIIDETKMPKKKNKMEEKKENRAFIQFAAFGGESEKFTKAKLPKAEKFVAPVQGPPRVRSYA